MARLKNPSAGRLNSKLVRKLLSFPDTDAGNAEAFDLLHGHCFRHDHSKRRWLVWNRRYWALDEDGKAMQAALRTARVRRSAALTIQHTEKENRPLEWAFASESAFRRKTMLESAQSIPSMATISSDFDRAPFLLTVGNGVEGQSSTITFAFYDPDGNGEAVILEFCGGAQVPANEYANAQKRVRDLLWEARRRHRGKRG